MDGFEEGYDFFEKNMGSFAASNEGAGYVNAVNNEIDNLVNDLNNFKGFKKDNKVLKGDIAEFWHSGTFNINSVIRDSKSRTTVNRSHDFASPDITSNDGTIYGLKYYNSADKSAAAQSVSIFQRYAQYSSKGGTDTIDEYISKRGYTEIDSVLHDPIYSGQVRIIPKDQLETAVDWLKRKIAKESCNRPEQVQRYQDTLNLLQDRVKNSEGIESIPLSKKDAEELARLSKEGKFNPADWGLTTEELIKYKFIMRQAVKAGTTSAIISMVLKIAPELLKTIEYLIQEGEIDEAQFKKLGFAAFQGAAEGFLRGSVSAAITAACKAGLWGESLKNIEPSVIGVATVVVIDTLKNSFKVATGEMTQRDLVNELLKEMLVASCSLIGGGITQAFIGIPVLGFMLGSFIGSVVGSFVYSHGYNAILSFCVDSGFTMFGLVEQSYVLPTEIIKEIGIDVFEYEKFDYDRFEYKKFEHEKFAYKKFNFSQFDITFLRRGVIGISKIGYI